MVTVPVLMYHRVDPIVIDRNTVSVERFALQLDYLSRKGYTTLTLAQLYEGLSGSRQLPSRSVVLTFDDGYADIMTYALPLLQRYNMKASVFVVTDMAGQKCSWLKDHESNQLMTWEQMEEWLEAGMEIGSHTLTHPRLNRLSDENIQYELVASKEILETRLKTKVEVICYPYGDIDERVIRFAREAGYKAGLAIFDNVSLWNQNLFAISRLGISSRLPMWEFKLKVSKLSPYFIGMRILERKCKRFLRRL
ncbi:polysaccharide deacetylase family protein [Sporomusa sphaeroides]|uniref:polysaccharide deacetylase family protein n=1 Tax=Sporomusa sphaeroides TaxID=47679 RepID=UPI002BC9588B|nr:polysaccharide deacetylase family protein [Sporomusa sphaeroides]HML34137.1 polysaccharide deacetylase family protein [Sporomusa sphaeroides]